MPTIKVKCESKTKTNLKTAWYLSSFSMLCIFVLKQQHELLSIPEVSTVEKEYAALLGCKIHINFKNQEASLIHIGLLMKNFHLRL